MQRQTREHDPRPFLTIIAWPEGIDHREMAEFLAQYSGVDPATLRLRIGNEGPSIVGQVDPRAANRTIEAVMKAGGDAFAPTLKELASLGPALLIRDLSIREDGNLHVELWKGMTTTIRREHVRILIRGQLKEAARQETAALSRSLPSPRFMIRGMGRSVGAGVFGAMGVAARFGSNYLSETGDASTRSVRVENKLDIHTTDRSVYQIVGRRFSFNILGKMRQPSDLANMDMLCDLLSHLAPDEIVDPYYPLWRPPPGYQKLRLPRSRAPQDAAFEFYSRWAALMYRYLLNEH